MDLPLLTSILRILQTLSQRTHTLLFWISFFSYPPPPDELLDFFCGPPKAPWNGISTDTVIFPPRKKWIADITKKVFSPSNDLESEWPQHQDLTYGGGGKKKQQRPTDFLPRFFLFPRSNSSKKSQRTTQRQNARTLPSDRHDEKQTRYEPSLKNPPKTALPSPNTKTVSESS